jgi:hypothetical protein
MAMWLLEQVSKCRDVELAGNLEYYTSSDASEESPIYHTGFFARYDQVQCTQLHLSEIQTLLRIEVS